MAWLKHTYATQLPPNLYAEQAPVPISDPQMALFNEALARELGIAELLKEDAKALAYLSGNETIPNSQPIAQAYAGHQFGHFTRLGDGRAVLLGEVETQRGLYDLQLKGSGQTPYSRRGDGRATFYSMLREYLISEALHALHIPTSRSLAVVKTAGPVYRERIHQGGVLTRVAASHIRVGTFEYARFLGEAGDLQALLEYTIERHYPALKDHLNPALGLLEIVMQKQRELIVNWLRVGFIHGVMNTDNVAISGETIDYGPCAFMNVYHPRTVFSSIDTDGRYAFANQPNIAYWNLGVFANAILPLIDEEEATASAKAEEVLDRFPEAFTGAYFEMMGNKLGIVNQVEEDRDLVNSGLKLLAKWRVDYTNFFTELRRGGDLINKLREEEAFENWYSRWEKARLRGTSLTKSNALMAQTNPVVIPRNHLVEEVLQSAVAGDMQPFLSFLQELSSPYDDGLSLQTVPAGFDASYQTFCGT
ncbi:protein adenylyltransferase SelO [Phaeodactylibacter sp.]|uniref:protein adenylyltransferase SelO n=1 Tax=Phaeodactylibacter sp. TaxID=1940289 RepID=UPI0025CC1111|nr:YdiU family protein [Phaeodactylibacter sp.]MCI4650899.1 YdiU family protein [Phaeodactylibacter sp.]MCI5089856.1 YdiU family protein [Phaeodactylibacter sp.]